MEGFRHQGRPVYYKPTPDTYAYQNLYGTVRGSPTGKTRPSLDLDNTSSKNKKFNFLPWKKNKGKSEDSFGISGGTLSKHNKYKFGSVSALSSSSLHKDWDSSLSTTPSYSTVDLKHATVRSIHGRPRGLVTYPWESYNNNNNNESINFKNNNFNVRDAKKTFHEDFSKPLTVNNVSSSSPTICKCQKKKSGFGTLNLSSMKSSKCNCGFSSVRSSRGFAPPPPPRRRSILPEKLELYAVHEDQIQTNPEYSVSPCKSENIYNTLNRNVKYKAPKPPSVQSVNYNPSSSIAQSKLMKSLDKCKKDPFSSVTSRKSILECDVTAYDLVKTYLKKDSSDGVDSDLDDDLSDNILEEKSNSVKNSDKQVSQRLNQKSYKLSTNKSPSPVSSESESGIYSQTSSLRIGGHGMKVLSKIDGNSSPQISLYSEGSKTNSVDSRTSSWSTSSLSDDGIYSLPEPDYDDDKDYDSVVTLEERIYTTPTPGLGIRKYPSGLSLSNKESASQYSTLQNNDYNSTKFSTIRKATSMVSLVSGINGESGTLRNRGIIPRIPEVPTVASSPAPTSPPPPPPPPPPMSDFNQWKSSQTKNSLEKEPNEIVTKKERKIPVNNISSSIASELAEKLKSNQPILKKNEIKPKEPMKVNSHNPYAEVKSILKKTGEKLVPLCAKNENEEKNSNDLSETLDSQDIKKKKRVQFKSLSNESLAIERVQSQPLTSSDEEWEEARENFSNENNTTNSEISRNKNDEDFQTVDEYLKSRKEEDVSNERSSHNKGNSEKGDTKVNSKLSTIPRPSQPPPPPPNIRKGNSKGPPPTRPLSSTPKSLSHCDLRVTTTQRPSQLSKSKSNEQPLRPGQQKEFLVVKNSLNKSRVPVGGSATIADSSNAQSSFSNIPKNGPSSPAASLEVTTSLRGKPLNGDTEQTQPDYGVEKSTGVFEANIDDSSSDSSYMSLPRSVTPLPCDSPPQDSTNLSNELHTRPSDYSNSLKNIAGSVNFECKPPASALTSITCTILNKANERQSGSDKEINNNTHQEKSNDLEQMDSDDNLSDIKGPVYSQLLYVSRQSPSPPPLPKSLPPLPPKRSSTTTLSHWPVTGSTPADTHLYDTLPLKGDCRKPETDHSIYESRRYSDTGATVVTISSGVRDSASEHIYSSLTTDSIYEELPETAPTTIYVSSNPFGRHRRSFFEGASKAEILKFLERAKERVVHQLEDDVLDDDDSELSQSKNARNNPIRISNISSSSDTSTISSNSSTSRSDFSSDDLSTSKLGPVEIERADSGVGSETSKPSLVRRRKITVERRNAELCADCDQHLEQDSSENLSCCPLVCDKCDKKRSERKEIVTEIVETEFKYGKDLLIIKEEFKIPMKVAGLLTKEQLNGIFINLDELILVNSYFSEKLKDAIDIAAEQGDEDYTTVNIGKIFLETTTMLRAFEVYCIKQGCASVLLTNLEKEKELLRIFLRVSQMENTLLRRMNLSAFLMVPVQRVTKYPLLLSRLYKVTPYHHKDREALREAQLKIELHLEQINQQTKGITGTKIWRRISNISATHRRSSNISDIGSIQLRKMAMETLGWSKEDIRFVMAGKLCFSGTIDFTKSRRGRAIKFSSSHALLATKGKPNKNYRPDLAEESNILFPKDTGIQDATLLLMKERNGRYTLAREPLHLGSCVISAELEDEDIIEIQEYTTKESIYLKAECKTDATEWLKQLRYHAKDLGTWKRRRNALANIMINGMIRQQ